MGRPLRFQEFERILKRYRISIEQGSKATHYKLAKIIRGEKRVYTIAVHRQEVLDCYIRKVRRIFELLPEHGVSDGKFFG